jgi:hypothetical protein
MALVADAGRAGSRILFVGNSFVSRNDLPGMVARLAASTGHPVQTRAIVAGGASLRRHLNAGAVATALKQCQWDYLVLQEQSTLPLKNPSRYHQNVRDMQALARGTGVCTVLYMTWTPRSDPDAQPKLACAVQAIGLEIGARVAPAGLAWQIVLRENPDIGLYASDGIHPTMAGSWLAAYVLFRTVFRDFTMMPPSDGPEGMTAEVADALARAADRALDPPQAP